MKKINKLLITFIIALCIFLPLKVNALTEIYTPSDDYNYSHREYVIDNYYVDIKVNENNTFDITEKITAYFNTAKHGIYRSIPLKNKINRLDGTTSSNRARVTNLKVNDEYTTFREDGNYKIKIGDADRTLTGKKQYIIKYNYNIGKDPLKDKDELYFNIIGDQWDTVIGNIDFKITMPKEFDETKLGFASGSYGSTDYNVSYNVEDKTITGNYNGILDEREALTIRCELPDNYFVGAGFKTSPYVILMIIIPLIFVFISIFLWYKFGKDNPVIETVEFYPPEGFNSLEVGFLYKGNANNQDATSLLIYLANKGYIKISEYETKILFSKKKSFKITKIKEYDGTNENEKLFLKGLFDKKEDNSKTVEKNEVTETDLMDNFYITMKKILRNVNTRENKNKIFEKKATSKNILIVLMIIATFCIISIPPLISYGTADMIVIALLFPIIGFSFMFSSLLKNDNAIVVNGRIKNSALFSKAFIIVWGLGFGGMPLAFTILPAILDNYIYIISYVTGVISIIIMIICLKYLPKRTPYGNEILGKLRGFVNFLETAEKEKLEAMVEENPSYFYNILPYTYVLGVSDKWIKKFETISIKSPTWYDSPNSFDVVAFGTFMNNTMVSAQSSMSSSPSSGSSGGGSSGGGSGGGGGGSW